MPDELLSPLAALGYPNENQISNDKYEQTNQQKNQVLGNQENLSEFQNIQIFYVPHSLTIIKLQTRNFTRRKK